MGRPRQTITRPYLDISSIYTISLGYQPLKGLVPQTNTLYAIILRVWSNSLYLTNINSLRYLSNNLPFPFSLYTPTQPECQIISHTIQMVRRRLGKVEKLVYVSNHWRPLLRILGKQTVHKPLVARLTTTSTTRSHFFS